MATKWPLLARSASEISTNCSCSARFKGKRVVVGVVVTVVVLDDVGDVVADVVADEVGVVVWLVVAELVAALFDRLGLVVTSVFTGTVCVTTGGGGSGSGPE